MPAELFASVSKKASRRPIQYKRFASAAEAIRYALEQLPEDMLNGAVLEVGDERLEAADIRKLYESSAFPLDRS
jgi:Arc/MetJ-type ribon-helix-helix transcriptional regulator